MHLQLWQLVLALCAAYGIGLAKTGITGMGIISVSLFAYALGAPSVGIVVPLLVCTDCIAVLYYRRHAVWSHLWRLLPWAALGLVLGWLTMRWLLLHHINDHQVGRLIGGLLIFLILLQFGQRLQDARRGIPLPEEDSAAEPEEIPLGLLAGGGMITITLGLLAGFTTMIANASGPLMVLYLLAARLPKMEFVGTSAWYYFLLNLFKLPLSYNLGFINLEVLRIDLWLAPIAILGAFSGRLILPHINQRVFENLALFFTALAAIKLLWS